MRAAKEADAPVILQASRGARSYSSDSMIRHMVSAAEEMYPDIPICLHQDHGNNQATCLSAIQNGFTSVMMDGSLDEDSTTPATYEYNSRITKAMSTAAHSEGVSVEGELGCLGSLESKKSEKEDGVRNLKRSIECIISNLNILRLINKNNTNLNICNLDIEFSLPFKINTKVVDYLIKNIDDFNPSIAHLYT